MNTFEYYKDALKNYVKFDGRASRKQYWYFALWNIVVSIVVSIVLGIILQGNGVYVSWIYSLAILLPSTAILIRRLHDIGKVGWWAFILLIPIVGVVIILVFLCTPGEPGTNKYGTNPNEVVGVSIPVPAPVQVVTTETVSATSEEPSVEVPAATTS